MRKNKIAISVLGIATVISIVFGYSLVKQNKNDKYNQLAVMTQQDDGTYIRSNMSAFENNDYKFDHAVCNNGTTVTVNPNGGVNLKLLGSDKCTVYLALSVIGKIKASAQSTKPDFTQVAQETGVYIMEDDYGKSYYFRGNVENNYVNFGDFYWRIVRINGDGTLRIAYDGTTAHTNGEESADRALEEKQFNTNYDNNAYVGYMYGDINGTTYDAVHANIHDSTIKTYLDSWYETNIRDKGLAGYISDTLFCNDRSLVSGTGVGMTDTIYGAYTRAEPDAEPILTCPQKNDAFTVSDTVNGNGALTYPIGLLTADEYKLAGGGLYFGSPNSFLSKLGILWLLSSPFEFDEKRLYATGSCVDDEGFMSPNYFIDNYNYSVVPVINMSAEAANQLKGSGTMENPYTLE